MCDTKGNNFTEERGRGNSGYVGLHVLQSCITLLHTMSNIFKHKSKKQETGTIEPSITEVEQTVRANFRLWAQRQQGPDHLYPPAN